LDFNTYSFLIGDFSQLYGSETEGGYIEITIDNISAEAYAGTSAIPEPASLLLVGLGLAGLYALQRRRSLN